MASWKRTATKVYKSNRQYELENGRTEAGKLITNLVPKEVDRKLELKAKCGWHQTTWLHSRRSRLKNIDIENIKNNPAPASLLIILANIWRLLRNLRIDPEYHSNGVELNIYKEYILNRFACSFCCPFARRHTPDFLSRLRLALNFTLFDNRILFLKVSMENTEAQTLKNRLFTEKLDYLSEVGGAKFIA